MCSSDLNFFKLRDLMEVIDVYVGYDNATRAITLDTSKEYELEQQTTQPNSPGLPSNTTTPPAETSPAPPTVPDDLPPLPAGAEGWARALVDYNRNESKSGDTISYQAGDLYAYMYYVDALQRSHFEVRLDLVPSGFGWVLVDSSHFEIIS